MESIIAIVGFLGAGKTTLLKHLTSTYSEAGWKPFVILNDYDRLMQIQKFKNKTQTIKYISQNYDLHENTIWNILKDHRDKFVVSE